MAEVRRFEDLICWQKARQLCNAVYELTSQERFARDFNLRGQIQAAAGSAMHNIAEGRDAGTDVEYISDAELGSTRALADEVKKLVNGLIAYLRKSGSSAPSTRGLREVPAAYLTQNHGVTTIQPERE